MPEFLYKYEDPRDNKLVVVQPGTYPAGEEGFSFVVREDGVKLQTPNGQSIDLNLREGKDGVLVLPVPVKSS